MSARPAAPILDRYTEIGMLSVTFRGTVRRTLAPLAAGLVVATAILAYEHIGGTWAFALISAGTMAALVVWSGAGTGLPLLPILVVQNLVIYGVPIVASHENILTYPTRFVTSAGAEVMVMDVAMALAWWAGMRLFNDRPPVSLVLHEVNKDGVKGWRRIGFGLISCATVFQVLAGLNLLDAFYGMLPSGGDSLVNALVSVISACGFFLVSMVVGAGAAPAAERASFWVLLLVNVLFSASSFLLAGAAACLLSVAVGLFWGSGRVPWRFLALALSGLAFFNVGKTTMRARYWGPEESATVNISLGQMPGVYAEWCDASVDALLENRRDAKATAAHPDLHAVKNQTLLDRIDNLENLLFVIDAMETERVTPLRGATYWLIPPLLVPRIFWPDKPRSHEGQVLLNVHFGRQDLNSTFTTYIAWGLLPEAYGNFGPVTGAVGLGVFLGFLFAWIEKYTARKLLISCEGFVCLSLLMNLINSFEMVASVLVTSVFQSLVIVVAASLPFVRRVRNPHPDEVES